MKKQILTLTMCLALTATSALADGTKTVPQANGSTATVISTAAPKVKTQAFVKPGEQVNLMSRDDLKKHFEDKKAKERGLLYSSLNFSEEQIAKAEALDAKTRAEAGKYLRKVQIEARKLRELKARHASFFAIYKQKFSLKSARAEANKYFAKSKKSFESILTKEQKVKFKVIDEAKKAEINKFRKEHKQDAPGQFGPKGPRGLEQAGPSPEGMAPKGPHGPEQAGPPPKDMGPVGPPTEKK